MIRYLVSSFIIAFAVIFHALWTTHHSIFLSNEDKLFVLDAAVEISVQMEQDKASCAHVGHYIREYKVDVLPEYLKREVIREICRFD